MMLGACVRVKQTPVSFPENTTGFMPAAVAVETIVYP
jgi:hypothetical protein